MNGNETTITNMWTIIGQNSTFKKTYIVLIVIKVIGIQDWLLPEDSSKIQILSMLKKLLLSRIRFISRIFFYWVENLDVG